MDPQPGMSNPSSSPSHTQRTMVQLPEGPMRVVLEQPRRFWSRLGSKLLWIVLIILVLVVINQRAMYQEYLQNPGDELHEKFHSLNKFASDKIAIIEVEGTIISGDGFVKKQIDRVRNDEHVKAVVLRVDSPGGTVTGSDYIYHHLKQLIKEKNIPMVVSMGSLAASGGYYVSMAVGDGEKLIYAEPTTWTGSIGVIIPHYDISGLLEKWDVADDSVASGPLKQMLSPTRKLSPELRGKEQAVIKSLVDQCFAGFKQLVLDSRTALRNDQTLQDTVFTGQIFTAKEAQKNGLVDEIGFVEEAIDRAVQLASLSKDNVRVVKYKQPLGALSELLGATAPSGSARIGVSQLLDLTAPRAYFLCTWLPNVVTTAK
jgi:protease IV